MSKNARLLALFAKWPQAGAAKTRLGPAGVEIARAFLLDSVVRLGRIDAQRIVAFAPPDAEKDFGDLVRGNFQLVAQKQGDLGQRLSGFLTDQFRAGFQSIVVLGSDSPTMPLEHVETAFALLESADVVLGPATDGGYYLLGCAGQVPPIFEDIAWSGSRVLADTIARLGDPQWRVSLLPPWYDVDTPEDWDVLCGHIAALRRCGLDPQVPHSESLMRQIHSLQNKLPTEKP
jgi:rSAM/selenodomain-associated transferase 1